MAAGVRNAGRAPAHLRGRRLAPVWRLVHLASRPKCLVKSAPPSIVFRVVSVRPGLRIRRMADVTRLLDAAAAGDGQAAAALLPFVYDELRRLAAGQLANEAAGHTLDATALVHEAYLRLVGRADSVRWEHRRHFVAAAAEAMRRIL